MILRLCLPITRPGWVAAALLGSSVLLGAPGAARAQDPSGRFAVTTRLGGTHFDRAASLETTPFVGLDATYGLHKYVTLGMALDVMRPNTRAEDYLTTLNFGILATGDTTWYYYAGQRTNLVNVNVNAGLRYPMGRFTPFALAGGGIYGMFLDPQINRGYKRLNGASFSAGAGVNFKLSDRAGIQFDLRDMVLTNYDRLKLDPTGNRFPDLYFPDLFPTPPKSKDVVHNLQFSLGFRYVPRAAGGGGGGGGESGDRERD